MRYLSPAAIVARYITGDDRERQRIDNHLAAEHRRERDAERKGDHRG